MKESITTISLILNQKISPLKSNKIGKKQLKTVLKHTPSSPLKNITLTLQTLIDLHLIQHRSTQFRIINQIFQFLKDPNPFLKQLLFQQQLYIEGKIFSREFHRIIISLLKENGIKGVTHSNLENEIENTPEFRERFHQHSIEKGIERYLAHIKQLMECFPENYFSEEVKPFMISPDLKLYVYQDTPPEILFYICNFAELIIVDTFIIFEISKEMILRSINVDEIELEEIQLFIQKYGRSVPDTLLTLFQEIEYHHNISYFQGVDILSAETSIIAEIWRHINQKSCERINQSTLILKERDTLEPLIKKLEHLNIKFSFNWEQYKKSDSKIDGGLLVSILNQVLSGKGILEERYRGRLITLRDQLLQNNPGWINDDLKLLKFSGHKEVLPEFYEQTTEPKRSRDLIKIKRYLKRKIIEQERVVLLYQQLSDQKWYRILVRPLFFDDRSLIALQGEERRTFLMDQIFDLSEF